MRVRLPIVPLMMKHGIASSGAAPDPGTRSRSGVALFQGELKQRPVRASLGLAVEYAMFASGASLALGLFATRVPLRLVDRVLGLRLRERFTDLLAKVSPG
jgi:hypothetical protein